MENMQSFGKLNFLLSLHTVAHVPLCHGTPQPYRKAQKPQNLELPGGFLPPQPLEPLQPQRVGSM